MKDHADAGVCPLFGASGETITREEFEQARTKNPRAEQFMDVLLRQVYDGILRAHPAAVNRAH